MKNIGKLFLILLSLVSGPLELLFVWLLFGKNESNNVFIVLGFLLLFALIYRVLLFVIRLIFYKFTADEDEDMADILSWISMLSYVASWFILIKVSGQGVFISIILSLVIFAVKGIVVLPGGSMEDEIVNSQKKSKGLGIKTVYYTDQFGNYKGSSTTYDLGSGVKTTLFRDSIGNNTGEMTSYDFHDDDEN